MAAMRKTPCLPTAKISNATVEIMENKVVHISDIFIASLPHALPAGKLGLHHKVITFYCSPLFFGYDYT
jgi:hypothetical protein